MTPISDRKKSRLTRRDFLKVTGVFAAGGLAISYPVMIERYLIGINHYTIPVRRLPPAFDGFTVVHLTDLHLDKLTPLPIIEYVIKQANHLKKDIIVLTGDYVHGMDVIDSVNQVWPVLMRAQAPQGVYAVLGNHDHWADTQRSNYWLRKSGFNLSHKAIPLERGGQRIWLGGTGDYWEDRQTIDEIFNGMPEDECKIVLAHNPDSADVPFQTRIDLMISGHTHGGQVRLPFVGALRLPVKNKIYSSGLVYNDRFPVFISRGIGYAIYPVRFNCPPEVAVMRLISDPAGNQGHE